jgi:hypothetical protein
MIEIKLVETEVSHILYLWSWRQITALFKNFNGIWGDVISYQIVVDGQTHYVSENEFNRIKSEIERIMKDAWLEA